MLSNALAKFRTNALTALLTTGILIASAPQVLAQADAARESRNPIPIINFTNEQWLGQYVANVSSIKLYELISNTNGLSLLARTYTFNENSSAFCVAEVGLAFAPSNPEQHPRLPTKIFWGASSGKPDMVMEGETGCAGKALKKAISSLLANDPKELEDALISIVDSGGKRATKPKNNSRVSQTYSGMGDIGATFITDALPGWFPNVFDYRYVRTRYAFNIIDADAGRKVCIAVFGMTSRSPDDKNPRYPMADIAQGKLLERVNAGEGRKDAVCFEPLFNALVAQIEPSSQLVATFVENWNLVSEPGLRRPSKKAIADSYALWNTEQVKRAKDRKRASRQQPAPRYPAPSTANRPPCINPATGLPMIAKDGSCGGLDVMGNPFGMKLH